MFKWAIRFIILIIAVFALLVAAIVFVVDPNDFKDDIQKTIKDKAGLDIRFEGPLAWSFFPSLAINTSVLKLYEQDNESILAAVESAHVGVKVRTVFDALRGKDTAISFDDISINGLFLNLVEDENGQLNIAKLLERNQEEEAPEDQAKNDSDKSSLPDNIMLELPNIKLTYSSISYTDKTHENYQIDVTELLLDRPSLNKSFSLLFDGRVRDSNELDVFLKTVAKIAVDLENKAYAANDFDSVISLQNFQGGQLVTSIKSPQIIFNQLKEQLNTAALNINTELKDTTKTISADLKSSGLHYNLANKKLLAKDLNYSANINGISANDINSKGTIATLAVNLEQMLVDLQSLNLSANIGGLSKESIPGQLTADKLSYAINDAQLTTNNAVLNATVKGFTQDAFPAQIKLSSLKYGVEDSNLVLNQAKLEALGILADINIDKAHLGDKQTVAGNISTNTFNLSSVLSQLGQDLGLPKGALNKTKINSAFKYTGNGVALSAIKAELDDTSLNGAFSLDNFSAPAVTADLNLNSVNLNRYLKKDSGAPKTATANASGNSIAAASQDTSALLPLDELRKLNLNVKLKVGSIVYDKQRINDFACAIRADGQHIKLSACHLRALGGKLTPQLSMGLAAQPKIQGSLKATGFKLEELATFITDKRFATGDTSMQLNFNTAGNSKQAWISNNNSQAKISLDNAVIKSINLSNILNEKLGTELSQILTTQLEKNNIKTSLNKFKDTNIKHLATEASVTGSTINLKEMSGTLKTEDKLRGSGSFDIISNNFDANLKITLANHNKHPYLANVEWPLRCSGNISQNPASWCGVDQQALQGIVKTVATKASQAKARELLERKLGVTLDPNKSLEQAAQDEIRRRAKEKAEAEQKKLNEKINKKLGEKLDKEVGDKLNKALGDFFGR